MNKLRLIVKVPHTTQVAEYSWQDTIHYKTFDIEMPAEVAALFEKHRDSTITAVEPLFSEDAGR